MYITSPLHQIEKIPVTLKLLDENTNELGSCLGDYCDLELVITPTISFSEQGKYQIKVLNTFNYEYLPNVLSVAIQVE